MSVRVGRANPFSLWLLPALGLLAFAIGCPERTMIGSLQQNPGRYYQKQVAVGGRVTSSFGALGAGAFQVDDGSGRIWVIASNYGVPGEGAQVGVVGRVIGGVTFMGRSFGTAIEQTQRPHY